MLTRLKISWICKRIQYYALAGLCFLISCVSNPDPVDYGFDKYFVEMATALENHAFLLDTGQTIYDGNQTDDHKFASGDRIYLYFSYGNAPSDPVVIHSASKIFSDTLKTAAENKIFQSANDPVRLESVWVGSCYLNLKFYMEYRSSAHKLALWVDETQVNAQEIHLYFTHDKNNDAPGYPVTLYASYDLSKVLGRPQGGRILYVHFNTTNYGDKTCTLNY